jgi:hypothetical protein
MAFVSIGSLATNVLHKARLQAAANEAPRMGSDGPMSQGGGEPLDPSPIARLGGPARTVKKEDGGSLATPASARFRGDSRREGDGAPPVRLNPGLKLVSTTCEPTHRPNSGRPIRRVGSHLVLISSHSPTTQSAKSGTA